MNELIKFEKKLDAISKGGAKYAMARALTATAFKAREFSQKTIADDFINRNKWTRGSIAYRPAKKLKLESSTGSTEKYMETQEFGGIERAKHGGVVVPHANASGETTSPRQKLVKKVHKMKNIKFPEKRKGKVRKVTNYARAVMAAREGYKHVYMSRTEGIKSISKVRKKKGKVISFELTKIHDLSNKSIKIKKHGWLIPASIKANEYTPRLYKKFLLEELQKRK